MKLRIYLFISILLSVTYTSTKSQNLVIDGSFENYVHLPRGYSISVYAIQYPITSCHLDYIMECLCDRTLNLTYNYPKDSTRWNICKGWVNPAYDYRIGSFPSNSTPDYFNSDVDSNLCPRTNDHQSQSIQVGVPKNAGNYYNSKANHLVSRFETYAHDGKGYIGLWTSRSRNIHVDPYTEFVAQKLDRIDTSNYLKPGIIYNVSFRVSRASMYVEGSDYTESGHYLKRLSMFLWDKPLLVDNEYMGIKTSEFQKETFMVNQHNDPSGYLTAEGSDDWNLVSENFVAEKKLNYIYIASFDYDIDSTGRSLLKMDSLIKSTSSSPDTSRLEFQSVYYYIDSVNIDSVGTVLLCDCDEFDIDIHFNSKHVKDKKCCKIIYVKIDNQAGYCKISDIRYKSLPNEWKYINITDAGLLQIPNGLYYPIDTICYDNSNDGDTVPYIFEFKPYGKNEFSCPQNYEDIVSCCGCPCDWVTADGLKPDIYEPKKFNVRLESKFIGRNENNECCFDLKFFNHTDNPFFVERFRLSINGAGVFTNNNEELIYKRSVEYSGDSTAYDWFLNNGQLFPWDTISLGTLCINDSAETEISWDMIQSVNTDNSVNTCFPGYKMMTTKLSCDQCCPNANLYYEMKTHLGGCCIYLKSFDNDNCGSSTKFYKVINLVETEISLPYELCATNNEFKLRIKLFDENDSLICVRNYNFEDQIENCDCCEFTKVNLIQDNSYAGIGCRFLIGSIYETCGFDSTYKVEYGKLSTTVYDSLGTFNYGDELDWEYVLSDCDVDTLVFKFIKDGNTICQKTKILECQTCEGASVTISSGLDTNICCLMVVTNSIMGCPYYFKYAYEKEDIPNSIDINGSGFFPITPLSDTLIICGKGRREYNDSLDQSSHFLPHTFFYYGVYDKNGKLLCQNYASRVCEYFQKAEIEPKNNQIFEKWGSRNPDANSAEQLLITSNTIMLETFGSNKLIVSIYDLNGYNVIEREINNITNNNFEFSFGNLTSGVYSLIVTHDTGHYEKLIKIVK